ncbi:MAG: ATP-binding protein [Lachnospiraceae bacterium]|nr:ATP-binding protein [Lachnospiraceae bacterium]
MKRYFNIEGSCHPDEHYMVDLGQRLDEIKIMIDNKKYFSINRSRQYGKTTTLEALSEYLKEEYTVISLDFQMLGQEDFKSESAFVAAFSREVLMAVSEPESIPEDVVKKLTDFAEETDTNRKLSLLFLQLSKWCRESKNPVVLMIDEVDSASNNQVFLDFLSQLRGYYLHRRKRPTFHSVILAGVYDIKNLKHKIRPDEEHKTNSPWNVCAKFEVEMSFSTEAIGKMLQDYEDDFNTGMNIQKIANLIYDYEAAEKVAFL